MFAKNIKFFKIFQLLQTQPNQHVQQVIQQQQLQKLQQQQQQQLDKQQQQKQQIDKQKQQQQIREVSIRGASPCPSHDEAAKLNTDSLLKKGEKKLDEETKQVIKLYNKNLTG